MNPTHGTGQANPIQHKVETQVNFDSTKPSKACLPKGFTKRFEAAKEDFSSSFSMIGSFLSAPFHMAFGKPSSKFEIAENVLWTCLLPATVPLVLGGALLMLPITLVSGAITFAAAKSTQDMVSYHPKPKGVTPPRVDDV